MRKYALPFITFLFLAFWAITSNATHGQGDPQPISYDQYGGAHVCSPVKCLGNFNTFQTIEPKVREYLCRTGICQIGVNPFVTAHVQIVGDDTMHVRFHVVLQSDGTYRLQGWSVTASCSNPEHRNEMN
jgi:hypothetical protein